MKINKLEYELQDELQDEFDSYFEDGGSII